LTQFQLVSWWAIFCLLVFSWFGSISTLSLWWAKSKNDKFYKNQWLWTNNKSKIKLEFILSNKIKTQKHILQRALHVSQFSTLLILFFKKLLESFTLFKTSNT
jgi:hypothetical protein